MGGVDAAIDATIAACILIILLIMVVLWARGELDNYEDLPEPEEPDDTELVQPREPGPDEYRDGKFIIRAPRAGEIVTEAGEVIQTEESA